MQYDLDLRARGKPARDLQGGFLDGGETNCHGLKPAERERTIIRGHRGSQALPSGADSQIKLVVADGHGPEQDRKSTRLNSSHTVISYAVFCLKKKKQNI